MQRAAQAPRWEGRALPSESADVAGASEPGPRVQRIARVSRRLTVAPLPTRATALATAWWVVASRLREAAGSLTRISLVAPARRLKCVGRLALAWWRRLPR